MNLHEWKEYVRAEAGITEAEGADLGQVVTKAVQALSKLRWEKLPGRQKVVFSTVSPSSRAQGAYNAAVRAVRDALSSSGVKCSEHPSQGRLVDDEQASTMFACPGGQVHVYSELNSDTRKFDLVIYAE